jgi:hypothetical protein
MSLRMLKTKITKSGIHRSASTREYRLEIEKGKWQRTLTVKGNGVVVVLHVPVTAMTVDRRRRSVLPVDTRQGNTRISAPVHP